MKRWGIWGAATIAREWVIGAIRAAGGEVVSLCSADAARGRAFAERTGIPAVFTRPDDFLGSGIDMIYVATVNSMHCVQTVAAAGAGKHVLCEKPLATTLADGQRMIDACRRNGVVLAANHHLRTAAPFVAMRRLIAEGAVGTAVSASVVHAGLLPEHLQGWRIAGGDAGAGVILDLTVHDADLLRFILRDEPVGVFARGTNTGLGQAGVEDVAVGTIAFASGLSAGFHDAFTTPYAQLRVEVHGTRGSLIATDCLQQTPGGRLVLRHAEGEQEIALAYGNLYRPVIAAFHGAVDGNCEPVASGADGLASLAVALAARRSVETGRFEAVTP